MYNHFFKKEFFTVKDLTIITELSVPYLNKLIKVGTIPGQIVKGRNVVTIEGLDYFVSKDLELGSRVIKNYLFRVFGDELNNIDDEVFGSYYENMLKLFLDMNHNNFASSSSENRIFLNKCKMLRFEKIDLAISDFNYLRSRFLQISSTLSEKLNDARVIFKNKLYADCNLSNDEIDRYSRLMLDSVTEAFCRDMRYQYDKIKKAAATLEYETNIVKDQFFADTAVFEKIEHLLFKFKRRKTLDVQQLKITLLHIAYELKKIITSKILSEIESSQDDLLSQLGVYENEHASELNDFEKLVIAQLKLDVSPSAL